MDEKLLFAERLKAAMTAAGLEPRPVVLERGFNTHHWGSPVTFQAVRRWLRGDSLPTQDKIETLARWLKVSPHALRFGALAEQRLREQHESWVTRLSPQDQRMIEAYSRLAVDQQKVVRDIIAALAAAADVT